MQAAFTTPGTPEAEERESPRATSSRVYSWVVLAVPLLGVTLSVLLANTEFFRTKCKGKWLGKGDEAYTTHDTRCDVLIFGDSTAITGLDTRLIERETRLKVCNISQTMGVLSVMQFAPLDVFLENNPRPKYLVMQFAGDNLAPFDEWTIGYVEGMYQLLAFFPPSVAARKLLAHPDSLFAVSRTVMTLTSRHELDLLLHHDDPAPAGTEAGSLPDVFFTLPLPPRTRCDERGDDARRYHIPSAAWVEGLRARYERSADRLLIDVAPTADCDRRYPALRVASEGLADNEYERIPIGMFNEGLVHFTAEGSERLSRALVAQIRSPARAPGRASDGVAGSERGPRLR